MFRKNKIDSKIKQETTTVSSDFDSLEVLNNRLKQKRLAYKFFVKPMFDAKDNCLAKYNFVKNYCINHWKQWVIASFYLLILATFLLTNVVAFLPFYGSTVGLGAFSQVSNFYTASLNSQMQVIYGITPLAIAWIVMTALSWIAVFCYFKFGPKTSYFFTNKKRIVKREIWTGLSLLGLAYLIMLFIFILIPPNADAIAGQQLVNNAFAIIAANRNPTTPEAELAVTQAMNTIYVLNGYKMPSYANITEALNEFRRFYELGYFDASSVFNNYLFTSVVVNGTISQLSVAGIVLVVFYTIFISFGFIIIPLIVNFTEVHSQYVEVGKKKPSWTLYKRIIYQLIVIKNINFAGKIADLKTAFAAKRQKETYSKYKKKVKDEGFIKPEEAFASDQIDNTVYGGISKAQIESHEPNKAFLNDNGEWMYHDGKHHYFVAKNDTWIPYDINHAIHKANADKLQNATMPDMPKKAVRDSKLLKNKNKSQIELPDDDLDEIIKKLDI